MWSVGLSIFGFNLTGGLPSNLRDLPVKPLQHGKKRLSLKMASLRRSRPRPSSTACRASTRGRARETITSHSLLQGNVNRVILPGNKLQSFLPCVAFASCF